MILIIVLAPIIMVVGILYGTYKLLEPYFLQIGIGIGVVVLIFFALAFLSVKKDEKKAAKLEDKKIASRFKALAVTDVLISDFLTHLENLPNALNQEPAPKPGKITLPYEQALEFLDKNRRIANEFEPFCVDVDAFCDYPYDDLTWNRFRQCDEKYIKENPGSMLAEHKELVDNAISAATAHFKSLAIDMDCGLWGRFDQFNEYGESIANYYKTKLEKVAQLPKDKSYELSDFSEAIAYQERERAKLETILRCLSFSVAYASLREEEEGRIFCEIPGGMNGEEDFAGAFS